MKLNIDFWHVQLSGLTNIELTLLDRARKAISNFPELSARSVQFDILYVVEALIATKPLRINFRTYIPGSLGETIVGPQTQLTDDLFEGDVFKKSFIDRVEAHFQDFMISVG